MSVREQIMAELRVPNINVRVSDLRWAAREQWRELDDQNIISYRPNPAKLSLAARLGNGRVQNFGQLMFLPANVEMLTTAANNDEKVRTVRCRFSPAWFREIWDTTPSWEDEELARCFDMRNQRVEDALRRLGAEALCPGFASEMMVESLSTIIAIEIARYFDEPSANMRVRTFDGKLTNKDLTRIYDFIDGMDFKAPTIEEIAQACGISSAHLRRAFKSTTGNTIHEHVEASRLRKAKNLLASTDLPLKIISYRLGFANASTFSSTFRKATGETPSSHRYQYRH